MRHLIRGCIVLLCIVVLPGILFAQGGQQGGQQPPGSPNNGPGDGVTAKDIDGMIKRGVEWLKGQQQSDGSWDFLDKPFSCGVHSQGGGLGEGCTAFCTFALLKAGVSRKDPAVQKGLKNAKDRIVKGKGDFCHCYCVACLILLLEAYYVEEDEPEKKEGEEEEKDKGLITGLAKKKKDGDEAKKLRKRAAPADVQLIADLVKWLVSKQEQQKLIWRYPGGSGDIVDASNTQYVMLALAAARRMRIPVPVDCYLKVVKYFLEKQEKKGPEVPWFPVPAADHDFRELKKIEKQMVKEIRKLYKEYTRQAKKKPESVPPKKDWGTTVVEEAQKKIFGAEKQKMYARGWAYMPDDTEKRDWCLDVKGSMTTSGCVSLIICKYALEEMKQLPKGIKKKLNKGIRDGAAWLAHMWRTDMNPSTRGMAGHLLYYWYGVERVGILGLIPWFGTHEWYKEGVGFLKRTQNPDGSWDAGGRGTSGPVPDTAWALLFLRRATTPLIRIPQERPGTGEDIFGPRKGK